MENHDVCWVNQLQMTISIVMLNYQRVKRVGNSKTILDRALCHYANVAATTSESP